MLALSPAQLQPPRPTPSRAWHFLSMTPPTTLTGTVPPGTRLLPTLSPHLELLHGLMDYLLQT